MGLIFDSWMCNRMVQLHADRPRLDSVNCAWTLPIPNSSTYRPQTRTATRECTRTNADDYLRRPQWAIGRYQYLEMKYRALRTCTAARTACSTCIVAG